MRIVHTAIGVTCIACSSFDSFEPRSPLPHNWGELEIGVAETGLDVFDRNLYTVVLDSALQGYAVRHLERAPDSVHIEPVLAGRHRLSLRGVRAYCVVDDGAEREFTMNPRAYMEIVFRVRCVPP